MSEKETGNRRRTERVHERPADPADTADRPLEPRSGHEPLHDTDTPQEGGSDSPDPHHRLNTPVGDVDPTTDSDPYRPETPEDDADTASGVRGEGEGGEDR
jgi:hypothetical protein